MELLAAHPKVDIHALNKFGCASVQWAAAAGNVATCRWLLSKGVSFNQVNHVRHGALNKAAIKGHVDAVRWLLLADDGPRLTEQLTLLDLEGRTVADLARLMGQDAMGAWLDELIAEQEHTEVQQQAVLPSGTALGGSAVDGTSCFQRTSPLLSP